MSNVTRAQFLRGDWESSPLSPSPFVIARIKPTCLTRKGIFCHSCSDACEPDAIRFAPAVGRSPTPGIDAEACTGCGECIATCPTHALELTKRKTKEDLR